MSDRATTYLFISRSGITSTIFDSQVVKPLLDMRDAGLVFDLMAYRAMRERKSPDTAAKARVDELRGMLTPGRVWLHSVPRPETWLGSVLTAILAAVHLWPSVLKGKECVCHCRAHRPAFVGVWVKRLVPRCRIVFDMRGDVSEVAEPGSPAYATLKRREARSVNAACRIICVSERFRRQVAEEYPEAADKITVIPCAASVDLFHYDPAVRERLRLEIGVGERPVLVYCGGLKSRWHVADTLLTAFRDLNAVASPTKLAEYLMTGLPVVASEGVGDVEQLFSLGDFGDLVSDIDDIPSVHSAIRTAAAMSSSGEGRASRAERAAGLLSSQYYLPVRLDLYRDCSARAGR